MGIPISGELQDISEDANLAHAVLKRLGGYFDMYIGEYSFSGYARKQSHGFLYVQVWDRGQVDRTMAFRSCGYSGIVHIDVLVPEEESTFYSGDFLGVLKEDYLDGRLDIPETHLKDRIWFVQDGHIQMEFPLRGLTHGTPTMPNFGYFVGDLLTGLEDEPHG